MSDTDHPLPRAGHLRWPYPATRCANADCPTPTLTPATEAVLFTDLTTGKLTVFCGSCSLHVELHRPDRWQLVLL